MRSRRAVRSVKFSTPRRMRVYAAPAPPLHRRRRNFTHHILHSHTPKSVVVGAAAEVCCAKTWSNRGVVNEIKRKDLRHRDIHTISYCTILWCVCVRVRMVRRERNAPPNSEFMCRYVRCVWVCIYVCLCIWAYTTILAKWNITILLLYATPCNLQKTFRLRRFF